MRRYSEENVAGLDGIREKIRYLYDNHPDVHVDVYVRRPRVARQRILDIPVVIKGYSRMSSRSRTAVRESRKPICTSTMTSPRRKSSSGNWRSFCKVFVRGPVGVRGLQVYGACRDLFGFVLRAGGIIRLLFYLGFGKDVRVDTTFSCGGGCSLLY